MDKNDLNERLAELRVEHGRLGVVNRPLFAGGPKVSMDGAYGKK